MVIDLELVIEPWLTDQWFCNAKKLSIDPINSVKQNKTNFVPKIGKIHFLIGWKIFNHGVFQDNYGGDIKYQHGMVQIIKVL